MNRLLACLFSLTSLCAQAQAIEPVEVCQLECIRRFDECLARNAVNPIMLAKCEAQRVKCICDCSKYELARGSAGDRRLPLERTAD